MMRHVYTYGLLVGMTALFHVQFTPVEALRSSVQNFCTQSMKIFKNDVSKLQEIKGS